jgi:putative transposase
MKRGLKMSKEQLYYTNRHSVYFLQYHLVVVTKYRHPVITGDLKNRLFEISRSIIDSDWKCNILEMNSDQDHIHILFEAPPHVQLSKLINNYKTVTSRLIRKEFQEFLKPYYWKPYFWSDSYFICTVSDRTEEMISHYIQNQ